MNLFETKAKKEVWDQNPPKQPAVKISDFVEVEAAASDNTLSGAVFLFCNRRGNILKAIWWDRTGFWTAQKKLEKYRWPWSENKEVVNEINSRQMAMLLTGIDFTKMHEELHFEKFA